MRVLRWTVVVIAAVTSGCGDKSPIGLPNEPPGTTVHVVRVAPDTATLTPGATRTIAVSVDADAGVVDRAVLWTSSDSAIASVSTSGIVTAGNRLGSALVIASSKADPTVRETATINVIANPAAAVVALRKP